MQEFSRRPEVVFFRLDACYYGSCFLKPTGIMGTLPNLRALECRCMGGHFHERLQGSIQINGKWVWKTKLAGAYSVRLCRSWANLIRSAAPKAGLLGYGNDDEVALERLEARLQAACGQSGGKKAAVRTLPARHVAEWPSDAPQWGKIVSWIPPKQS